MICRRSSGSRASPPGSAGCSTASTCTSTRWWRRRSSPSCWRRRPPTDPAVAREELVDSGGVPGRLGARRRLLRPHRRSARPQPRADADDPHLRALHRAVVLRADVVAAADLPFPRRARHRRRMGGGRVAAVARPGRGVAAWMAAVLQTGVNIGVLLACSRSICWPRCRRARCSWSACCRRCWCSGFAATCRSRRSGMRAQQRRRRAAGHRRSVPRRRAADHRHDDRGCARSSLTAYWAFMFWQAQHLRNLPELASWPHAERERLVSKAIFILIARRSSATSSRASRALARLPPRHRGDVPRYSRSRCSAPSSSSASHDALGCFWFPLVGFFGASSRLFTMYLPPLFPTLLRTTGAGFCYNIGRIVAAAGTVVLRPVRQVGDFRVALLYAAALLVPPPSWRCSRRFAARLTRRIRNQRLPGLKPVGYMEQE